MVEFEIFATACIIGGSLVAYQIGYVADRCPRRQFHVTRCGQGRVLVRDSSLMSGKNFKLKI